MNRLWDAMSSDMNIVPFTGESDGSFLGRLCFSGLALWCLKLSQISPDEEAISKAGLSRALEEIEHQFYLLAPSVKEYLSGTDPKKKSLSVFIRRVYEETGYLITDTENRDELAFCGRTIAVGVENIYYGLPAKISRLYGMGVYTTEKSLFQSRIQDVLLWDNLNAEEYFERSFNICDFEERDINLDELEFFDPKKCDAPSACWGHTFKVDATIARKCGYGPYLRVLRYNDEVLFLDELSDGKGDLLTSCEYRRLYCALRAHYNNAMLAWIREIDDNYSEISFQGLLPNREYYFLLLISWPKRSVFDRSQFIIRNDMLNTLYTIIQKVGIEIRRV